MRELGVFPNFLGNDLLKVEKVLGLTFLRQGKTSKDSKRRFFIYCSFEFEFCARWIVYNSQSNRTF